MTAKPLFLLAIDHRRSFERLFGLDRTAVDAATRRRLVDAKVVVHDALVDARRRRPDLEGVGILIDDDYGAAALDAARVSGVVTAVAVERSGMDVFEFEHADWRERLAAQPPTFAKVLVRHRVDGDAEANAVQLRRLGELSEACADAEVGLLLEVIAPFTDAERTSVDAAHLENDVRPRLVVDAIDQMQQAGIEPDVWKVEGIGDAAGCAGVVAQARVGDRDDVGVVVLGAGADDDTVRGWITAGATVGYTGFAVGRSIWADPLQALAAGAIDEVTARRHIADMYLAFVDTFRSASS